jgi:hypothetical protein
MTGAGDRARLAVVDPGRVAAVVRLTEHRRFKRVRSKSPNMDADARRENTNERRASRGVRS